VNLLAFSNKNRLLTLAAIMFALSGCSGGGGSSTAPSNSAPTPVPQNPSTYSPTVTPGTTITDIKIESLSTSGQTNTPITFGHVFAVGDLQPTEQLAGRLSNNTLIPLQVDVKATHADGSVRHAIISGILPAVTPSSLQTIQLIKATLSNSSQISATPTGLMDNGATASVNITLNGVSYSASLASMFANAQVTSWLAGPIVNEWHVSAPFKNAQGVAHPHLTAHFAIRSYTGQSKARVDVTIENNWTFVPTAQNQTYDVQIVVAGQTVYSKSALTHYHHARWRKLFWWGSAPLINIQHNIPYLLATKAVPNYDQSIVISPSGLNTLYANWQASNTEPMGATGGGPGIIRTDMTGSGGRPDIGMLPQWAVMYLLSMDNRAKTVMLSAGDQSGSWPIHYRDEATGFPVRLDNPVNQNISVHPNAASSGPLPVPRCFANDDAANPVNTVCYTFPVIPDAAHEPSLDYVPYLVTGDYYYLEELQFWAAWNPLATGPSYRDYDKGLTNWQQIRGQAWSLRTMGQAAYITPDTHFLKQYLTKQLNYSIDFYTTTYVVGNPNPLGVLDGSGAGTFSVGNSIQPWQDDFFTWSVGYLNELGFTSAHNLLVWKAKFQVGRMDTASTGYCWIDATTQALIIRPASTGPTYATLSLAYQDTFSNTDANINAIRQNNGDQVTGVGIYTGTPYLNYACGSQQQADWRGWQLGQMVGYSYTPIGTPAILGAALAIAADSSLAFPHAQTAWNQYLVRSNKPDFTSEPEWAIVPR
jgi:hypothetical protein